MNLFRSEEHIARWLDGRQSGRDDPSDDARPSTSRVAWWHHRLAPDWRPHTREQNQAILDRLGLTGEFWRLP